MAICVFERVGVEVTVAANSGLLPLLLLFHLRFQLLTLLLDHFLYSLDVSL